MVIGRPTSVRSDPKSIPPQPFADDHHLPAAGAILVRSEYTAGNRGDTHHRKEIGRHARADQLDGFAGARQIEVAIEHHACHALERPRSRLPLGQFMRPTTLRGSSAPRRSQTITSRSGLANGNGWRRTVFTMLNAAVVAPMVSAISTMTKHASAGARLNIRHACRRS